MCARLNTMSFSITPVQYICIWKQREHSISIQCTEVTVTVPTKRRNLRNSDMAPASPGAHWLMPCFRFPGKVPCCTATTCEGVHGHCSITGLQRWAIPSSLGFEAQFNHSQDREREQILNPFQNLDYSTPSVQLKVFFLNIITLNKFIIWYL